MTSTHSNIFQGSRQLWCRKRWGSRRYDGDNSQWSVWTAGSSAGLGSLCTALASASHTHLGCWQLTWKYSNLLDFIQWIFFVLSHLAVGFLISKQQIVTLELCTVKHAVGGTPGQLHCIKLIQRNLRDVFSKCCKKTIRTSTLFWFFVRHFI